MWWGDQDLVKLGIKEHNIEKKTLGGAVPFTEMLNFLSLGISMCLCTCVPWLVHNTVFTELLQSHDLPHCPARSPSKQELGGFVLAFKHTSLFHMLFHSGRRRTGRYWHLRNNSPPEELPSLILTTHRDHTPPALLTVWLCHYTGQMSWADCQEWVLRGEKRLRPRRPTSTEYVWFPVSKELMLFGALTQVSGQNWWLSRREYRKLSLFRKEDRREKGLFSLLMNMGLSITAGISPHFLSSQSKPWFFPHTFPWCRHSPESFSCSGLSLPACAVVIPPWPHDSLVRFSGERRSFMLFSHHRDPDQVSAVTAGMLEAKKKRLFQRWFIMPLLRFCQSVIIFFVCVWLFVRLRQEGASSKMRVVELRGDSSVMSPCSASSMGD